MKLKELRLKTGLNQTETANLIGIPRNNYNKYELGQVEPDIGTLCKLADYFGVSIDYLCEHKTDRLELPPFISQEDKNAVKEYFELSESKRAMIRGEIKAMKMVEKNK